MPVKKRQSRVTSKVNRLNSQRRPVKRSYRFIFFFSLAIATILVLYFWGWNQFYSTQGRAASQGFVDANRTALNSSNWFNAHDYSDCSDTANNFWATNVLDVDCLIDEPQDPPTAFDQTVAKDPSGLYYKHFLPTDWFITLPDLFLNLNIDPNNLSMSAIDAALQKSVAANPSEYANISVDSLIVGVAGGNNGTMVESTSLMVHPQLERPIATSIGYLKRAQNIYKPYIEEATGATISDADLLTLYTDAIDKCGENALNNDNSGRGAYRIIGSYAVIVQGGDPSQADPFNPNDCDIHVVKLVPNNTPTLPASTISPLPSTACLGSCPTPTSVIPTVSSITPATSPAATPLPVTPTISVTVAPGTGGGVTNDLLQLLLNLITQLISLLQKLL